MRHINIDGVQNVEVSKPIPSEKSYHEQIRIMAEYTETYKANLHYSVCRREIECLKVLYPRLLRSIEPQDLFAGRLDFLPIGFGCVTSVGGVGHYCVFHKLRALKQYASKKDQKTIDALYDFWQKHDLKTLYCQDVLNDTTTGRFIDCSYPFMATARLSGMMLDYSKLMRLGICGLRKEILSHKQNDFLRCSYEALKLFSFTAEYEAHMAGELAKKTAGTRRAELQLMQEDLLAIKDNPPATFHQALQLFWLYAILAGCINYGRMDEVLGPFLKHDLDHQIIAEEQAYDMLKSLWTMIENRRTTVNGRIIVGGQGRSNPEAGDLFTRLALRVCKDTRYVEPQFTLRFDSTTPVNIKDAALDCIGAGATYPTLYNDDVNVSAVMHAMRVPRRIAEQYVPFGCGEFVIQGKSVGTPNTLLNLLKILQIAMNEGVDPFDGIKRNDHVPPLSSFHTFNQLRKAYETVLDSYFDLSVQAQKHSYEAMNKQAGFLFPSILMDNCIEEGKALLDGGVEILGGTNETYGNINTSDSLFAIKKLVFEQKKYTLAQINNAALHNFEGFEQIQKDLWNVPKYGNDDAECDAFANEMFEYVAKGIRRRGIEAGIGYYLIVISNNQTNTDWGHMTDASYDGRKRSVFMNPANNPQGNAAKSGPTAVLNSLSVFKAKYHGGSVQNIKFTPRMFSQDREKIKMLFKTYFAKGGCQLMITVVDRGTLEDAQKHPEKYPDLLVRVAGYSARFIDLTKDIQDELLSRELYD